MKTIEDAVIELGGKLPCNTMQHSYAVVEGMLLDRRKTPTECYVCKVEEFEQAAKRLGFINEQPKDHIVEANEMVENNWHERGELPPVGCDDFEWSLNGECWEHGLILFNDGTTCLIANKKYPANRHHLKSCDPDLKFRPIRTHREKVIEAAENGMLTSRVSNVQRKTINRLYDLGMLVLPGANCNTKD